MTCYTKPVTVRTTHCVALAGLVLVLGARAAGAQSAAAGQPAAALLGVRDADPLELARVVARVGDGAVLALLAGDRPVAVRLAAVRAAPWLREPERALAPLAELIASRDSELAPAAARAALRIAQALTSDALGRRERSPAELGAALKALLRAAELPRVRADLQRMAAATAEQLRAAGVGL